jgi:hypothetical protein
MSETERLLKEIAEHQRELDALVGEPVVDIFEAKRKLEHQAYLKRYTEYKINEE